MDNSKCNQIINQTNTEKDKIIIALIRGYCRFCNPNKQKNKYCAHFTIDDEDNSDDENYENNQRRDLINN